MGISVRKNVLQFRNIATQWHDHFQHNYNLAKRFMFELHSTRYIFAQFTETTDESL